MKSKYVNKINMSMKNKYGMRGADSGICKSKGIVDLHYAQIKILSVLEYFATA